MLPIGDERGLRMLCWDEKLPVISTFIYSISRYISGVTSQFLSYICIYVCVCVYVYMCLGLRVSSPVMYICIYVCMYVYTCAIYSGQGDSWVVFSGPGQIIQGSLLGLTI